MDGLCEASSILLCYLLLFVLEPSETLQRKTLIKDNVPDREVTLSTKDFGNGRFVADGDRDDSQLLYQKNKFEGDMDLRGRTIESYTDPVVNIPTDPRIQYNAIRSRWRKWPDGRIPYKISSRYTDYSKARIAAAMDEYAKKTCVKFVPRAREHDYIYLFPDDGCYSSVGRTGGRQEVSLDADCIHKGIIMHELMHTVGFFHEQSRTDRDDHIDIVWSNIIPGASGQFRKYSQRTIDYLGAKYDYGSIMHYSAYAFTRNGRRTILPKKHGARIGQRRAFSKTDLYKINKLYNCDGRGGRRRLKIGRPSGTRVVINRPTRKGCENRIRDCDYLSRVGTCNDEPKYMRKNCARSCGYCRSSSVSSSKRRGKSSSRRSNCRDDNGFCDSWARFGLCDGGALGEFVQKKCPASCGKC